MHTQVCMHDTRQQKKLSLDFNGTNQTLYIYIHTYTRTRIEMYKKESHHARRRHIQVKLQGEQDIFYFKGTKDVCVYTYTRTLIQMRMKESHHATD